MRRSGKPKKELTVVAFEATVTVPPDSLQKKIWDLPYLDRVQLLTCSIIEHEYEAFAAARGLIAMVADMSRGCSREHKGRVAEALRDAADVLDHALSGVAS